jgi:two-component system sensor histidine kinase AlgZ
MATTACIAAVAQYTLIKINYPWGNVPETTGQFVTRCLMISTIVTFVALRYFYVHQQWKQRIELESQARIDALQARIRPHFLFNSMNIIASLIHSQPDKAEQAVEDLSDLFRATLRDTGSMVTLAEEWRLCCNYLRIEGLRLGSRLSMEVDLSGVPQDAAIPMLTLQPLVENAIYHGIQPLEKGGTIKAFGEMQGNLVCISLSNPVSKSSDERGSHSHGNKMALANIRHRLNLLFGTPARLDVNITPDEFEIKVIFPYLKGRL